MPDISNPFVSIIIPTYNRPELLQLAINSILKQTYPHFEVIVVNDAGTDISDIIKNLGDERVQYKTHPKNMGRSAARNTGLGQAHGKYIAYLDDDDQYFPDHLETLVSFLENSSYQAAYTGMIIERQKLENNIYITFEKETIIPKDFNRDDLLVDNSFTPISLMHEKVCLEKSGLFDTTLPQHNDWEFFIRLSRYYPLASIPKATAISYIRDGDEIQVRKPDQREYLKSFFNLHGRYKEEIRAKPAILAKQMRRREEIRDIFYPQSYRFKQLWQSDEILKPMMEDVWENHSEVKLFTFDFFDTLVHRLCNQPVDLFREVGKRLAENNLFRTPFSPVEFQKLREAAEYNARHVKYSTQGHGEITLAEIYGTMEKILVNNEKAMEIEREVERQYCYINPSTTSLLIYLKSNGYRVGIVSDMYLSPNDLSSILLYNHFDITKIDFILTSCQEKINKSDGAIFNRILKREGLSAEEVIHLGDNYQADIQGAKLAGIHTYQYHQVDEECEIAQTREAEMLPEQRPVLNLNSIRNLAQRLSLHSDPVFEDYYKGGAFLLGPVLSAFSDWCVLEMQKAGIQHVLAFMREGELLKNMLHRSAVAFGINLQVVPLYVSREATNLGAIGEVNLDKLIPRMVFRKTRKVIEVLRSLGIDQNEINADDEYLNQPVNNPSILLELGTTLTSGKFKETIERRSAEHRQKFLAYFLPILQSAKSDNIAIVDLGWGGSIQKNIQNMLWLEKIPVLLKGYYLATNDAASQAILDGMHMQSFLSSLGDGEAHLGAFFRHPEIFEQSVNANTGSTLGYELKRDGTAEPIQESYRPDFDEDRRKDTVKEGIYAFQQIWHDILVTKFHQNNHFILDYLSATGSIKEHCQVITGRLMAYPTRSEAETFGAMHHEDNRGTDRYELICSEENREDYRAHGYAGMFRKNKPYPYWPQGVVALEQADVIETIFKHTQLLKHENLSVLFKKSTDEEKQKPLKNILFLGDPSRQTYLKRIAQPANLLKDLGYRVEISSIYQKDQFEKNDVLIVGHFYNNPSFLEGIKDCLFAKKPLIIDLDQPLHYLDLNHPDYQLFGEGNPNILNLVEKILATASMVVVPNQQMADYYSKWAKQVVISSVETFTREQQEKIWKKILTSFNVIPSQPNKPILAAETTQVSTEQIFDDIINAEDISAILQEKAAFLNEALLDYIQSKISEAQNNGEQEYAEGLNNLWTYIHQMIGDGETKQGDTDQPEIILKMLLSSDDLITTLHDNKHLLTPQFAEYIYNKAQNIREEGDVALAEGLESLYVYIKNNSDSSSRL